MTRQNVFETNSSSSHSISVCDIWKEDLIDVIIPDEDGVIILEGGEFGWGYEHYNDALTKANYIAADTNGKGEAWDNLVDLLKEQTGATEVIFNGSSERGSARGDRSWSYVDHQSSGLGSEYAQNKEILRCFIFNSASDLIIDNDYH